MTFAYWTICYLLDASHTYLWVRQLVALWEKLFIWTPGDFLKLQYIYKSKLLDLGKICKYDIVEAEATTASHIHATSRKSALTVQAVT